MKQHVLVIVPAYNEENSVGKVVRGLRQEMPEAEVLVVDDGSTDGTAREAAEAGARVASLPHNLGIGGAVQTGFRYAWIRGFDAAVQVDADGQHLPSEIPALLQAMEQTNADLVVGSRFLIPGGYKPEFTRLMGIKLFRGLLSLLCRQRLTDTTSGFRAANRLAIANLAETYACDYPEVESLVTLRKAGFRIVETPVHMENRAAGVSSIGPARAVYYMLKVALAALVDALAAPRRTRAECVALLEHQEDTK